MVKTAARGLSHSFGTMDFLRLGRDKHYDESRSRESSRLRFPRWFRGDDHDVPQNQPSSAKAIVTDQHKNKQQSNDVDGSEQAKPDDAEQAISKENEQPISIWGRAYDALKVKDKDLMTKYEKLLTIANRSDETSDLSDDNMIAQHDPQGRKVQMDEMMKAGQARGEENKFKYKLLGTEHVLKDDIASAVNVVLWGKDWIGEAVKASPEASVVWAGVSAVLPLLTNPSTSSEANSAGFNYVTSRMDWYVKFERLLLSALDDPRAEPLRSNFELHVQELYQAILEFQIRSILRFFQSRIKNLGKDMFLLDAWNDMANAVKRCEELVDKEARQIREALSLEELREVRTSTREMENMMKKGLEYTMTTRQAECHQVFRQIDTSNPADTSAKQAGYEDYKERVEERVENTCEWFLCHKNFQHWLDEDSGILLVTADPGCGKSVLAKYLVDSELIRRTSELQKPATICYFFFKDQIQSDINHAFCALLHQLFSQKPFLIRHAMKAWDENQQKLCYLTEKLWKVLQSAVADDEAGRVIFVLDALDECEEDDRKKLTDRLQKYFQLNPKARGKLSVFLTSRPYEDVLSGFNKLSKFCPHLRIPGEHESAKIAEETNAVIVHRIQGLEQKKDLKEGSLDFLKQRLLQIEHRTYLWLYLVFSRLENEKLTDKSFQKNVIDNVPANFDDAYEKIFTRSTNKEGAMQMFKILLASFRPLTVEELQLAFETDRTSSSFSDIDLDDVSQFCKRLRDYCGLFVSINNRKVYFLHQTAREFLISKVQTKQGSCESSTIKGVFAHSISLQEAHLEMAHLCMAFVKFEDWRKDKTLMKRIGRLGMSSTFSTWYEVPVLDAYKHGINQVSFLTYASTYWAMHIRLAGDQVDATTASKTLELSNVQSNGFFPWLNVHREQTRLENDLERMCDLTVISYFGLNTVMRYAIKEEKRNLGLPDASGSTPLHWAATFGHDAVVNVILAEADRVDVNARDDYDSTALILAVKNGHEAVVKLLLGSGNVHVNAADKCMSTALYIAIRGSHDTIVELLLDTKKVDVNYRGYDDKTALIEAAEGGHDAVIGMLLDASKVGGRPANVNARTYELGDSALFRATLEGHEKAVRLLLDTDGIDVSATDNNNRNSLWWPVRQGYVSIVRMLLETEQVDVNNRESAYGRPILWCAAYSGNEEILKLLLKTDKLKVSEYEREQALNVAIEKGHETAVKLIQDLEVNVSRTR